MEFKVILTFLIILQLAVVTYCQNRSFVIDYDNNQFLKDGQIFRYISGSIHYFRVPPEHWNERLQLMKAAGLNAISTYVIWNEHEPESGVYNFNGRLDLVAFIQLAQQNGLDVILRAGPYICAEVDMGGLPWWMLSAYPDMVLRTNDTSYLSFVDRWMNVLLPMIKPLLYENGGPIITVQVENEYGSYFACDFNYMYHLRDLFRELLGETVVLFTTDGNSASFLKCGKTDGLYATVDFSPGEDVNKSFNAQRAYEPKGPLINSEYYTYGHVHWGSPQYVLSLSDIGGTLQQMLHLNASVNMYMFHGGTNFGFLSGANTDSTYQYLADTTSYDFEAPISESGRVTEMYYTIRDVIQNFTTEPLPPVPSDIPLAAYGKVSLQQIDPRQSIFDILPILMTSAPVNSEYPLTFEELGQGYGFVMYETTISKIFMDPSVLLVTGIRDRGYVFIDYKYVGILSRTGNVSSLGLTVKHGQKLSIFVESQGRLNYGPNINDFKGIISPPTLDNIVLKDWTMSPVPLQNGKHLRKVVSTISHRKRAFRSRSSSTTISYPTFFVGYFNITDVFDTFILPTNWGKGIIYINGFNLGRYWPLMGPQVSLYVPKGILYAAPLENEIIVLELQNSPCSTTTSRLIKSNNSRSDNCYMEFIDHQILNGTTPHG